MRIFNFLVIALVFYFSFPLDVGAQVEEDEISVCAVWKLRNYYWLATYEEGTAMHSWELEFETLLKQEHESSDLLGSKAELRLHKSKVGYPRYSERVWGSLHIPASKPLKWDAFEAWLLGLYESTGTCVDTCIYQKEKNDFQCWDTHFINDTMYIQSYMLREKPGGSNFMVSTEYCCPGEVKLDSIAPSAGIYGDVYSFDIFLMRGEEELLSLSLEAESAMKCRLLGQKSGYYHPSFEEIQLVDEVLFQGVLKEAVNELLPFYRKKPSLKYFMKRYRRSCAEIDANKRMMEQYERLDGKTPPSR